MRVIEDDSRIVEWAGRKVYEGADGALESPGAQIWISQIETAKARNGGGA